MPRGKHALTGLLAAVAVLSFTQGAFAQGSSPPYTTTATCTALTFGAAPTTGSIGAASETDCFTFAGTAGDQIRIRAVETSGSLVARITVRRPNTTTICGPTTATDVTCALDTTGTHTIDIDDSSGTNTGNYSISIQRLNSPTGCTALTFGAAPGAGTIGAAAATRCYSFSGLAGDRVRIRVVETSGTLIATQETVRPNGTTACFPTSATDVTCALDTTGTYRVVIADSAGTNTGNFAIAIQRLNAPVGCTALTFGAAPAAGSIVSAAEMDCYSFAATSGAQIRIRVVETSGTLLALQEVVRPNGTSECTLTSAVDVTCSVDATGTHRIVVEDSSGLNSGNYAISIQRLNTPAGCTALTFGSAPLAGSISTAGEMDCFTFSGTAGDEIRVRVVKTSGTLFPIQELLRPNGTTICFPTGATDVNCSLDTTGTHQIVVEDSAGLNTGDYVIAIQRLNAPTGCTALAFGGAPAAASIGTNGAMRCFTFSGSAGDRIRVRVVETSGTLLAYQELFSPDGTSSCFLTSATDVTCLLDDTGTQVIMVEDSSGTKTGNFVIAAQRLNAPTGCIALTFGAAPTPGTLGGPGAMRCYGFSGVAGDQIRVRLVKTSGTLNPTQELVRPNGTTNCFPTSATNVTCSLDTSGTHRILVEDSPGTNTGNYAISIQRLNAPTGCTALTFGAAPTAGTLAGAGSMRCYSFTGAIGDRIRVRVVETSGTLFALQETVRPNGTTVCFPTGSTDDTCLLDATGSHRIIVADSSGTNTGDFVIAVQRLNSPTGCTALTFGAAPTAGSISTTGEMDCFSFTGSTGDRIRVRVVDTSGTLSSYQEVVRPNGATRCGPTSSTDQTCALKGTGTFTIIVEDSVGTKTGGYSIAVQRLNSPTGCTALTFGAAPTAGTLGTAGAMRCYSFNGAAGDEIRIRVAETSGTLLAVQEVTRPNGTTSCFPTSATDVTCGLDAAGTHRIIVEDSPGTNTGTFAIAVQRVNNPVGCTALTFSPPSTAGSIVAAGELDCYTFTGSPSDEMNSHVVETSGTLSALQDIARPNGTTICGATTATDLSCTIDTAGTHTIIVGDSNGTKTGTYTIQITT